MLSSRVCRLAVVAGVFALALAGVARAQGWDPAPVAGAEEQGDKTLVPIVFVHGQNGAGDQFERQKMHFTSNGYPASWIIAFDYNTAGGMGGRRPGAGGGAVSGEGGAARRPEQPSGPRTTSTTEPLDKLIDEVRKRTGHDKVNLVGHSRGTGESAAYLSDPARAAKIAHYASVGGGPATNPNGVASIAVSGMGDFRPGPAASDGGKVAWMPAYQDHVMVCTSDESFWEIYTFFNDGKKPKTIKMVPEEKPQVGGFVKSYIHNKPLAGAKVEVWEVAQATGRRAGEKPLITLTVDEAGKWGPFSAKPGQHYEFVVHGTAVAKAPRFFRTPFTHSDYLVYFRIAAAAEDYSPSPFSNAPELLNEKSAAFVVRHQNGALVPGVMSLTINGTELVVDPILPTTDTPRQNATVALYIADGDKNGKTDLTRIPGFDGAFVASADVFVPADPSKSVEFRLNDHVLNVPAYSGAEAGPISVVFEDFN
jgi:pimeloyl-ACP methyl ester carboxylesterase